MCLVPVVRQSDEGGESHREVFIGQFGLMPFWAKDPTVARRTYNARSETADTKPNFRDAWRRGQRCIIPAQLYVEPYWGTGKHASADGTKWNLYEQNLLSALRALEQVNNQVRQLQNQAQMILQLDRQLQSLPGSISVRPFQ